VAAAITSYLAGVTFVGSLVVWLVAGEVLHYAFGVQTAFLTSVGIRVPSCD